MRVLLSFLAASADEGGRFGGAMVRRTMTTGPYCYKSGTNNDAGDDDEYVLVCAGKDNEADDDDDDESVLVKIMKAWAVLVWSGICCVVLCNNNPDTARRDSKIHLYVDSWYISAYWVYLLLHCLNW